MKTLWYVNEKKRVKQSQSSRALWSKAQELHAQWDNRPVSQLYASCDFCCCCFIVLLCACVRVGWGLWPILIIYCHTKLLVPIWNVDLTGNLICKFLLEYKEISKFQLSKLLWVQDLCSHWNHTRHWGCRKQRVSLAISWHSTCDSQRNLRIRPFSPDRAAVPATHSLSIPFTSNFLLFNFRPCMYVLWWSAFVWTLQLRFRLCLLYVSSPSLLRHSLFYLPHTPLIFPLLFLNLLLPCLLLVLTS